MIRHRFRVYGVVVESTVPLPGGEVGDDRRIAKLPALLAHRHPRAPQHRDHDAPRDGHAVLAAAGGGGDASTGLGIAHNRHAPRIRFQVLKKLLANEKKIEKAPRERMSIIAACALKNIDKAA